MLIDWFTVGAQFINFVVLVWLLKRFLYKPVLNAIDAREKRVAATLADADKKTKEANEARDDLLSKKSAFDEERSSLLAAASREAQVQAERLLNNARQAAAALTLQRNAGLASEAAKLSDDLARLAASESIEIARAVLKDLADAKLETCISEVFIRRLRAVDSKTKESLRILMLAQDSQPVLASSFELSSTDRIAIQTALNETFAAHVHLRFETSSNAICGVELSVGGQRLCWTVTDYMKTLEEKVAGLLRTDGPSGIPATLAAA